MSYVHIHRTNIKDRERIRSFKEKTKKLANTKEK